MWSTILFLLAGFCATHANPPEFDTEFQEVTLTLRTGASIWCNASGDQPMNDEEISSNCSYALCANVTSKGAYLIFEPVKASHNRFYSCAAMNNHGLRVKSFFVTVKKYPEPPEFDHESEEVHLNEGSVASIWCNASGAEPLSYWWFIGIQDLQNISSDPSDSLYVSATSKGTFLNFNPVTEYNNRDYACAASNEFGVRIKMYFVIVQKNPGKPQFEKSYEELTVREGEPYSIMCLAMGPNPMYYKWFSSSEEELQIRNFVSDSRVYVQNHVGAELVFDHVQIDDAGIYNCSAINEYGSDTKTFYITVEAKNSHKKKHFI